MILINLIFKNWIYYHVYNTKLLYSLSNLMQSNKNPYSKRWKIDKEKNFKKFSSNKVN